MYIILNLCRVLAYQKEGLIVSKQEGGEWGLKHVPLPEIYPWVSSLFVPEEYRGNRISEKLIDFANNYASKCEFDRTYIPTEHIGLYEKFGYHYLKDIRK